MNNLESPSAALCASTTPIESLHDAALATAQVNNWPHAYALGYVSGLDDCRRRRDPEHSPRERDDYARGYGRGSAAGIARATHAEMVKA